jgi:hypothetical protein
MEFVKEGTAKNLSKAMYFFASVCVCVCVCACARACACDLVTESMRFTLT